MIHDPYSTSGQKRPQENASTLEDEERCEKLRAFYSGAATLPDTGELSLGGEGSLQDELAAIDALDDLCADTEVEAPTGPVDDEDDEGEVIHHTPEANTPYERAYKRVRELEAQREGLTPGTDEYHAQGGPLAEARRKLKIEAKRGLDEQWRKRRGADEWRRGEGREKYNAARRTKRDKPNRMTPKEELAAMTPGEREQHKKDKSAERVWKHSKRKAGWPEDRIEAELPNWWAKRIARREKKS